MDVGDFGQEIILRPVGAYLVEEVDQEPLLRYLGDRRVAQVDVLNETAAKRVRLEPQRDIQVGAAHLQVLGEDVAHSPSHLAADGDAAVAVGEGALADENILRRHVDPSAVGILAGLDGDAVITGVKDVSYTHL